ncbi:hypothetical protein, partial [Rhodococcus sp. WY5]|uniref:hypothetical protein n=1 Tax=Rhodococcus sp. WY5 TaxID=2708349 RepID=UPI001BDDDFC5
SLTFAGRLLNLIRDADDLAPLVPTSHAGSVPNGLRSDQEVVRQLVGALRSPTTLPELGPAVVPLARLARCLAENSAKSYSDAALAADLLLGLEIRDPLAHSKPGATDRADAVAALLDGCRSDPERMEQLAGAAARQLENVAGISESVRNAIARLLADKNALRQWGGTVLTGLAEAIVPITRHNPDLARHVAATILAYDEGREGQVPLVRSALMPLNESRRQQAEHSIYVLGEKLGELCNVDLLIAAEIFCDLAEDADAIPAMAEWPVSVADADGWLQDGPDLSLTVDEIGETAAQALSVALAGTEPSDAAPVVAVLVKQLHNAAAWAALMKPADHTLSALDLSRVLLPALESGALLAHPGTHGAAAALLDAVAASEPTLAGQLEHAVLNAHALADANHVHPRVKDALIVCLNPESITSPVLKARLEVLATDAPPMILSPHPTAMATAREWSPFDAMSVQGIQLDKEAETALRALDEEVTRVSVGADPKPQNEFRLPELFETADPIFAACEQLPQALEKLLVEAAALLARDERVNPGTPLGNRVLAVLTTAQNSHHVGTLIGSNRSPGIRDRAVGGLTALFARQEWRDSDSGSPIAASVTAALGDKSPLVRMHAAHLAVELNADADQSKTAAAVGELVLAEEDPTVRIVLLEQLTQVIVGAETTVDAILERIPGDALSEPLKNLGRSIMKLYTYLAIVPRTPYASRTVEQWCNDAPTHGGEVKAFAQCARDYLGPNGGEGRAEAYRLLTAAARSSHARWTRDPEEHHVATLSERQRTELKGVLDTSHEIARQIYFTSGGAYDYKQKQGPPPGTRHTVFAELAYPLLAICASLRIPQCIHSAVQTMIFLAPLDEARALHAVADAVPAHGPYAGDSLAGDDVIPYMERLLAENQQLVLHDTAGVTAFRQLLTTFASAGNTKALTLAYTFADVFR